MPSPLKLKFPTEAVVVLLHGFPDDNSTFQPLCAFLAKNGYRCLAPQLPGYGPLDDGVDCSLLALSSWVFAFLEKQMIPEGVDVHLVGHDWGSQIAQHCVSARPGYFKSVVLMSVPISMFENAIISIPRGSTQLLNSWYMIFFQLPFLPEAWLLRHDGLGYLLKTWSPTWDSTSYSYVRRLASIQGTLSSRPLVTRALSYYRTNVGLNNAVVRILLLTMYVPLLIFALVYERLPKILQDSGGGADPLDFVFVLLATVVSKLHPLAKRYDTDKWPPVLSISGKRDGCVEATLFGRNIKGGGEKTTGAKGEASNVRETMWLENCGHWPHVEQEDLVRERILLHLRAHGDKAKKK